MRRRKRARDNERWFHDADGSKALGLTAEVGIKAKNGALFVQECSWCS